MKTIRNMSKRTTIKKNLYKIIFTFLFTSVLVFTVPGGFNKVYAAPLEDCDLDGFDDATGVPVPWPGYDETKGDTPDGPAGSKVTPTTAPASTTEGSKDSATPSESSSSDTDKTDSTKANNTNSGSSTKTNSSTKDNTASTGTNKSTTSSNTKSSSTDKKNKSDTDNTSSSVKSNTTKTESNKENSTTSVNTSNNVSDKSSGAANEDGNKSAANANTTSSVSDESNADNTSTTEVNNQGETTQGDDQQSDVSSDNGEAKDVDIVNVEEVNTDGTVDDFEAVINTKGTLDITEASGSIVHVGSTVNIFGSGFAGNVQNLEIQIQSEAKQLGIVNSSEEGSFEAQLSIPEELEAGTHNIVVLYEGTEISRLSVEIGPKAADSFLQALTVGFTSDNNGLVPGLLILLGLLVVGVGSIGANALIRPKQYKG